MTKSTLVEIDRLEGIAMAVRRSRPILPLAGVFDDIDWARKLVEAAAAAKTNRESCQEHVNELWADLVDARADLVDAKAAYKNSKADLNNLMASLSARLER